MVLFTSGSSSVWGESHRTSPQVFACYLFTMSNFSHPYRSSTMSKFEFSKERVDRWGNSMQALWGSFGICPPTDHIGLPHHMAEELHSIGHLKVCRDVQKLHLGMAYLLVQVDDTWEAGNYGMAIVWINSCQARMVLMGETLETLSSLTPKGCNWPHALIQLYEGANHTSLPKDRHVCVLPQGEAESPKWADRPTKSPPTSIHRAIGCFIHRVEWGWPVSDHWFARVITHGLQCHHWRISLHRGQHSYPCSRRAGQC